MRAGRRRIGGLVACCLLPLSISACRQILGINEDEQSSDAGADAAGDAAEDVSSNDATASDTARPDAGWCPLGAQVCDGFDDAGTLSGVWTTRGKGGCYLTVTPGEHRTSPNALAVSIPDTGESVVCAISPPLQTVNASLSVGFEVHGGALAMGGRVLRVELKNSSCTRNISLELLPALRDVSLVMTSDPACGDPRSSVSITVGRVTETSWTRLDLAIPTSSGEISFATSGDPLTDSGVLLGATAGDPVMTATVSIGHVDSPAMGGRSLRFDNVYIFSH